MVVVDFNFDRICIGRLAKCAGDKDMLTRQSGIIFASIAVIMLLPSTVGAATKPQHALCANKGHVRPLGMQIKACSAAIQSHQLSSRRLAWAYRERAGAYYRKGAYALAIADYTQAIRLDPKNAAGHIGRALSYVQKREYGQAKINDYTQAINDYSDVIRLDPKNIRAIIGRGEVYDLDGKQPLAVAAFTRAIRLDPKSGVAYADRGKAYANEDAFARAIADYTRVIRLEPKNSLGYNGRADVYYRLGEYDRGNADYERAKYLGKPECQSAVDVARKVEPFAKPAYVKMATKRLRIPDLTFDGPRGRRHRLSEWRGRFVLLDLWLAGEGQSTDNLRTLNAAEKKVGDRSFDVIAIDLGKNPAYRAQVLKRYGINNVVAYSSPKGIGFGTKTRGKDSKVWQRFDAAVDFIGVPQSVLIGPHGCELGHTLGDINWARSDDVTLLRVIKAALAQ